MLMMDYSKFAIEKSGEFKRYVMEIYDKVARTPGDAYKKFKDIIGIPAAIEQKMTAAAQKRADLEGLVE
jgi:hypothetical protein